MNEETSRGAGFRVALTAGFLLLVGASLLVFVIPTVPNPRILPGGDPIPKTTLWEKWKWEYRHW